MELITEAMFKQYSPVKYDTVVQDFVPYIDIAQKMHLSEVLGPALMAELELQIKEAQVTPTPEPYPITPENQALLKMIAPALSFYAVYQGLPFHWASIVNKGLTVRESENSRGVDLKDVAQLRRWVRDDADYLLRQLIDYLCSCAIKYPLWRPGNYCGGGCDAKTNNIDDFGIYIPNK